FVRKDSAATENVWIDGGAVRVGVAEVQTRAADRRTEITAGRQVVLRGGIEQIAIDDVVAIAIGPATRGRRTRSNARDDARRRIVRAVDHVTRCGFQILAAVE